MDECCPTDEDLARCPHVHLTDDSPWDPCVLDNECDHDEFHDAISEDPDVIERRSQRDPRIDDHGLLRDRESHQTLFEAQDRFIAANHHTVPNAHERFCDAHAAAVQIIDPHGDCVSDVDHTVPPCGRASARLSNIA